jgi:hypothetical protein
MHDHGITWRKWSDQRLEHNSSPDTRPNKSKHYAVDFICVSHLLYFSLHLLMTNTLIRQEYSLQFWGRCKHYYKGLSERSNWCLQVDTHLSELCTVPKSFQCTFMTQGKSLQLKGVFFRSPSFAVEELKQAHLQYFVWNTALRPHHHTITSQKKRSIINHNLGQVDIIWKLILLPTWLVIK